MSSSILILRRYDAFSGALRAAGFEVENLELIRTGPMGDADTLARLLSRLDSYDGLFFTSPIAAQVFVDIMQESGRTYSGNIYVLGSRTAKLFETAGVETRYCPEANTAAEMLDAFGDEEFAGKRLCFIRGDHTVGTISRRVEKIADLDEIIVYGTIETPPGEIAAHEMKRKLVNGDFAWACFFSPSGVDVFCRTFGSDGSFQAAAIGSTTARRAAQLGLDVAFVSPKANARAFAEAFIDRLKSSE